MVLRMIERVNKAVFIAVAVMLFFCGVQGCTEFRKSVDDSEYTNSIGMEFVKVSTGEFMMGSPSDEKERNSDEGPVHKVTIEKPFYLGKFEVSQKQWYEVMGNNPSLNKGDELPVVMVSWVDAQEFIKKLNEMEGTDKYRLPYEAEWEYACRAGTTASYSFGDDESKLGDYAWHGPVFYGGNSEGETHPVGQKKPNPWGLYDMHGNVWEWCQDRWHDNYSEARSDGRAWGGGSSFRVRRGGSFDSIPSYCRSAGRSFYLPHDSSPGLGFRVLREM